MKKKKSKQIELKLLDVKLYLEDLYEVLDLFKKEKFEVEISDLEAYYDSLEDLKKHKGVNPKIIFFKGVKKNDSNRIIKVGLSGSMAVITAKKEEDFGVALRLEHILKKRERTEFDRLYQRPILIFIIIVLSILTIFTVYFPDKVEDSDEALKILGGGTAFFTLTFLISLLDPRSSSNIELDYRHERSFVKNNSGKIVVALFSVGVTLLLSYFFGLL